MISKKFKAPVQKFPKNSRTVFQDDYLSIKSSDNNIGYNKVGVLISKRISKKAVERNRIKRIIYDSFMSFTTPTQHRTKKGKDLLIIPKPSIINLTKKELENKLKEYERAIY